MVLVVLAGLWTTEEFSLAVCGSPTIEVDELKTMTKFTSGTATVGRIA